MKILTSRRKSGYGVEVEVARAVGSVSVPLLLVAVLLLTASPVHALLATQHPFLQACANGTLVQVSHQAGHVSRCVLAFL